MFEPLNIQSAADFIGTTAGAIKNAINKKKLRNHKDGLVQPEDLILMAQNLEDGGLKTDRRRQEKKPRGKPTADGLTPEGSELWDRMETELATWDATRAAQPCPHGPGSWGKQVQIAARLKFGLPMFHPSDAEDTEIKPSKRCGHRWGRGS